MMVSICCVTYNHGKYIKECIDSFLMQKTNFSFEIIIHDDASTDGTSDIVKEYAKKYPKIIRMILQKENQYEKGMRGGLLFGYDPFVKNVLPTARGKYIALCEGDDYWTDPNKLQKQVDYLEKNPDKILCYHPCKDLVKGKFSWYGKGENGTDYTADELVAAPGGIATSTKMFRNIYGKDTKNDFIDFSGDFLLTSFLGTKGGCGFVKGIKPSIYRVHSGGVWTGMTGRARNQVVTRMYNRMYELHKQKGNPKHISIVKPYLHKLQTFGIIIPTYQRSDGKTPFYLKRTLDSVFAQTHKDFIIYLIGDRYENEKEFLSIIEKYPKDRLFYENLTEAHERDKYQDNRETLWCSGGTFATNYGIDKAVNDNIQYVCLLDHDDYWLPEHLSQINKILFDTEVDWICTKTSVDSHRSAYLPKQQSIKNLIEFLPLPCGIIKSSVCFNIQAIPLRVRDVFAETKKAIPGDADLWERSAKYIKEKGLHSYFLNKHTCVHDSEGYVRHGGFDTSVRLFDEDDVTVITCTGDRPEAFALLRKWMNKQTTRPKQWIVVDDGKIPLKDKTGFEYHRREPSDTDYPHTLCLNLQVALSYVKYDKILIMEDDDWYSSTYVDYMTHLLEDADLVGFGSLIFYYPSMQKYMQKNTPKQPAFAQTAFRKELIPIIQEICMSASKEYDLCGKGLVDAALWHHSLQLKKKERSVRMTTTLKLRSNSYLEKGTIVRPPVPVGLIKRAEHLNGAEFVEETVKYTATKKIVHCKDSLFIGMKGLPGREGLTSHHNKTNGKYKPDPSSKLLKSILKKDAEDYLAFII